jgi:hypothetical protein
MPVSSPYLFQDEVDASKVAVNANRSKRAFAVHLGCDGQRDTSDRGAGTGLARLREKGVTLPIRGR